MCWHQGYCLRLVVIGDAPTLWGTLLLVAFPKALPRSPLFSTATSLVIVNFWQWPFIWQTSDKWVVIMLPPNEEHLKSKIFPVLHWSREGYRCFMYHHVPITVICGINVQLKKKLMPEQNVATRYKAATYDPALVSVVASQCYCCCSFLLLLFTTQWCLL